MSGAFAAGFRMGGDMYDSAQRMKLEQAAEERRKEEHGWRRDEALDLQRKREQQAAYERDMQALPTEAPTGQLVPLQQDTVNRGLRLNGQQMAMLAEQDAAFGPEGQLATLDAAATARGVPKGVQFGLNDGRLVQTQMAPRAAQDVARDRRDLALKYNRIADANQLDAMYRNEYKEFQRKMQQNAAALRKEIEAAGDDPEALTKLAGKVARTMHKDWPDGREGTVVRVGNQLIPVLEKDGVADPVLGPDGVPVMLQPNRQALLGAMDAMMLQYAENPYVELRAQNAEARAAAGEKRAQETHGEQLEGMRRANRVGAATEASTIEAANLSPQEKRAGINLKNAQAGYYGTLSKTAEASATRAAQQGIAQFRVVNDKGEVGVWNVTKSPGDGIITPPQGWKFAPNKELTGMTQEQRMKLAGQYVQNGVAANIDEAFRIIDTQLTGVDPVAKLASELKAEAAARQKASGQGGLRQPVGAAVAIPYSREAFAHWEAAARAGDPMAQRILRGWAESNELSLGERQRVQALQR